MKSKILFLAGLGIGYVLGARAGRRTYEKIKSTATQIWEDPRVQKTVHDAEEFVQEKAPLVQAKITETVTGLTKTAKEKLGHAEPGAPGASTTGASTTTDATEGI